MAGQQLPTHEERRQELEQRSAAKLTDELERVRENINKQLLFNISEKEREEERKRAQEQQNRLEQIQAASARAVEALKADEENAYHQWLKQQKLDVQNGIPNRPMFKGEFEEYWESKKLAIPAWDLGVFGTAPQAQPVPQYKKRDNGTWRWEERDYSATVFVHDRHPLCKSNSRKLAALGPVEPAAPPDPDNILVRLAAEVAKAASKEAADAAAAAKQQHRKEASRRPKKTSSQHASGRRTPGAHKSNHISSAADDEPAAAAGKHSSAADKAVGAAGPEPSNGASAATARKAVAAEAATEAASQAHKKQQKRKAANSAAAAGAEQQPVRKGGSEEFSERVSGALQKAARKLLTFGSLGSSGKHSSSR